MTHLSRTLFVLVLSLASLLSAQDNPSLAEGTVWPMGWQLPPPLGPATRNPRDSNADILVWVPPGATRIRSVLLVPNNTDSKDWSQNGGFR